MPPFAPPQDVSLPAWFSGRALGWAGLLATGLDLIVTALPWARSRPDLAARLARLDPERRLRAENVARVAPPFFHSSALETLLRPLVEDLGAGIVRLAARVGLRSTAALARDLRVARPGVDPSRFWGEAAVFAAIAGLLTAAANPAGLYLWWGPWPWWSALAVAAGAFAAPSVDLAARVRRRQAQLRAELPAVLDLLQIALASYQSREQALALLAAEQYGILGREFAQARREVALAGRPLTSALGALAERNGLSELDALVRLFEAAEERGLALERALAELAASLRETRRAEILAEGNRISVRLVLPVALCIFPIVFIILLYPAVSQFLGFGR